MRRQAKWAALGLAALPYVLLAVVPDSQAKPRFEVDVLPVLKAHCASCHQGASAAAGLDLTTPGGYRKGGLSGKLFIAGNSKRSLLMQRLRGEGGKPQMPMGFVPLEKKQLDAIAGWIDAGGIVTEAKAKHWAYRPPRRPAAPRVYGRKWVRNPIDAFVLAKLEKKGLGPSPEASKETLIRRLSLDLTGLPPTPEEVDAFLGDKRADAYERLVDKLLASPHYGERQARVWLDLARYADTNGYEADYRRTAWLYRDWLINAFNRNMPFDRFTIEQLAGDLLPSASRDQLIATGFHRNTMFNSEGGVDADESYFEVLLDRANTTATVWLGSTMACARCHDHKYDPFTQKDYYKLVAYFSSAEAEARGDVNLGQRKIYEPTIQVATTAQEKQMADLRRKHTSAKARLDAEVPKVRGGLDAWIGRVRSPQWIPINGPQFRARSGAKALSQPDGSLLVQGEPADQDLYTLEFDPPKGGWNGLRLEVLPDPSMKLNGPGRSDSGNFILSKVDIAVGGKAVPIEIVNADFVQQGYRLEGVLDDDPNTGWAVYGEIGATHELAIRLKEPILPDKDGRAVLKLSMLSPAWPKHTIGRLRLSVSPPSVDPETLVVPRRIRGLVEKQNLSKTEGEEVWKHYQQVSPELRRHRVHVEGLQRDIDQLQRQIPTALILRESAGAPQAYVRHRGEFMNKTELVKSGTPSVLGRPAAPGKNRLGLAKWLVSRENPLTARVQANRQWETLLGRGLVETSEDFGTQGSPPTHPELLDWLACELMDSGWDMKRLNRLIVTSATYRQSSRLTPRLAHLDPQNLLLARAPRYRLEPEQIRDVSLKASGLLNPQLGGPSVYPYQPEGIWDSPYSADRWEPTPGKDQYRRGIYVFWKRTAPYPSFMAFDAGSRESCTVRRIRTNTPLQALALLNDRAYLEAANALGKRMVAKGGIAYGFKACTGRKPTAAETARLRELLKDLTAKYAAAPGDAKKLAGTPREAAWTMLASVLLNLDETITRE